MTVVNCVSWRYDGGMSNGGMNRIIVPAGTEFEFWTVLGEGKPLMKKSTGRYVVRTLNCRCVCGKITDVRLESLRSKRSFSCGCETKLYVPPGSRFSYLTVLAETSSPYRDSKRYFKCLCDCGNETIVRLGRLTTSETSSCGCDLGNTRLGISAIPGVTGRNTPEYAHRRILWINYCLTLEQYNEMLGKQGGVCAMCQAPPEELDRSLCVDHDHTCCSGPKTCGKCIRGLLCVSCNVFLGKFERAGGAAFAYLTEYEYRESKVMISNDLPKYDR
jgi:hypothetical protein